MKQKSINLGGLICLTALAVRAAWVLYRWSQDGAALEYPDEELHWQLARNLITDGALVSDDGRFAARMPLYPLFLALFAWSGSIGVLSARIAQALLGAATVWIVHAFMRKRFDRRAADVAAGLFCVDPFTIFFSNLLLTEILYVFLSVALIICAWSLFTDPAQAKFRAVLGVAVLGLAALMTRPSAAGWILMLWLFLWLSETRRARASRRACVYATVMLFGFLPWGLRNMSVLGSPAWLSANGGVTLYDAQGPQADGGSCQAFINELPELVGLDEIERDQTLRRLAAERMRSDPARVIRLAWTKLLRTWNLVPNVAEHRGGMTAVISALFTASVIIAALWGLIRVMREKTPPSNGLRRLHVLLWLPIVYFTLVHCVFIGSVRYRVPLMPLLQIAAATVLVRQERIPPPRGDEQADLA